MGAVVEVQAVEVVEPRPPGLAGSYLDAPTPGSRGEAQALDVLGWALGQQGPVVAVEFLERDRVLWRAPVDTPRPDLTSGFPQVPWAGAAGFSTTLRLLGRTPELSVHVRAVLPDQTRVPLAIVRLRRAWRLGPPTAAASVSVVITCHGRAQFLPDAIESVLAQTHPHIEVLVVDDGSADNTEEVTGRYPGVRCVHQPNAGLSAARNTGLRRSNGDYLVFLDADDRLLPQAVQAGLTALRTFPSAAFVFGHYRHIDAGGAPPPTPALPGDTPDHYEALLRTDTVGRLATALYRREVFEHVTGFDTSLPACGDDDLHLRIARQFPVHGHGHLVSEHRAHGPDTTRDLARMLSAAMTLAARQRRHVRGGGHEAAHAEGVRSRQEHYGVPLARTLASELAAGDLRSAAPGLLALARHHPRALALLRGHLAQEPRR